MAQYWKIDPVKRDYVVSNGSSVSTDSVTDASYYAIQIPRGRWLYGDSNEGSDLFKLQNVKRTARVEQAFASSVQEALKVQVIADGKAVSSNVSNIDTSRYGTSNQINVVPKNLQISSQLNFIPL